MIWFKFKLKLTFINNKNYSFIIVNFHTHLCWPVHINLKLKFRKNKNYREKRTAHWYISTFLLLKPLKQYFIIFPSFSLLKLFYSWSFLLKHTHNFGSVFTNWLVRRIYETKYVSHISYLFSVFYLSFHFNISISAQNLPFICICSNIITLPVTLLTAEVET
jgi:hypothetical protein